MGKALNRTLLELKLNKTEFNHLCQLTLNRTLLELKFGSVQLPRDFSLPSIAPYWN